jgi:hypothetical protein
MKLKSVQQCACALAKSVRMLFAVHTYKAMPMGTNTIMPTMTLLKSAENQVVKVA